MMDHLAFNRSWSRAISDERCVSYKTRPRRETVVSVSLETIDRVRAQEIITPPIVVQEDGSRGS